MNLNAAATMTANVAVSINKCESCQSSIDSNAADAFGRSLLILAAKEGSMEICTLLLAKGADINHQDHLGNTALHYAFKLGYMDVGLLLKSKGANDTIVNIDNLDCYRNTLQMTDRHPATDDVPSNAPEKGGIAHSAPGSKSMVHEHDGCELVDYDDAEDTDSEDERAGRAAGDGLETRPKQQRDKASWMELREEEDLRAQQLRATTATWTDVWTGGTTTISRDGGDTAESAGSTNQHSGNANSANTAVAQSAFHRYAMDRKGHILGHAQVAERIVMTESTTGGRPVRSSRQFIEDFVDRETELAINEALDSWDTEESAVKQAYDLQRQIAENREKEQSYICCLPSQLGTSHPHSTRNFFPTNLQHGV